MIAMAEYDECRACGRLLDPFGQCFSCDTHGTPEEQAAASGPKRCASCKAMHRESGERCPHCETHNITPADYEAWYDEMNDRRRFSDHDWSYYPEGET